MTGAQFSLHVSLAMQLVRAATVFGIRRQWNRGGFDIPDVKEVADRVDVRVGPEQDGAFGSGPTARIVAELTDGRTVAAEAVAPGSPGNPLGWDIVAAKAHA